MKTKSTISSSGKNSPVKIDRNEEEKVSTVQVPQTSEVQPGDQESRMSVPQKTESESESLSSEESEYYSCEDADDFDRNEEEKVSTVQVPQTSEVQPEDQESRMPVPQKTESQSECLSSEESEYYSCEDADDFDDDVSLTKEQKYRFFQILKGLLEEPCSLKDGKKRKVQHDGKIFKLMYMTKQCEIIVQDLHGHLQFKEVVSTEDIYLRWCNEKSEPLSIKNLHKVRNEMMYLGFLDEKVDACFSTAINGFTTEPDAVQGNTTLVIITPKYHLTFVSGKGENEIKVIYDDEKKKPQYPMRAVGWREKLQKFLNIVWHTICELSSTFTDSIHSFIKNDLFKFLIQWLSQRIN